MFLNVMPMFLDLDYKEMFLNVLKFSHIFRLKMFLNLMPMFLDLDYKEINQDYIMEEKIVSIILI